MAQPLDEYVSLVAGLQIILKNRTASLRQSGRPGAADLEKAVEQLTTDLLSDPAKTAVSYAFTHLDPRVLSPFLLELQYVNANLPPARKYEPYEAKEEDEGAEDAKTAKDSLEDLLGDWLPDWLKKLLKVLNELISIVL